MAKYWTNDLAIWSHCLQISSTLMWLLKTFISSIGSFAKAYFSFDVKSFPWLAAFWGNQDIAYTSRLFSYPIFCYCCPWSSLVRGDQGSYWSNSQTILGCGLFNVQFVLFCNFMNATGYHLCPYYEPSDPSAEELQGLSAYIGRVLNLCHQNIHLEVRCPNDLINPRLPQFQPICKLDTNHVSRNTR